MHSLRSLRLWPNVDPVIQRIRGDWYGRNFKDDGLGGKSVGSPKSDHQRHVSLGLAVGCVAVHIVTS